MKSNYKKIGHYITPINNRNTELKVKELMGINIEKHFMQSVANTVGTDMSKYKIVKKGQFACNRMHVGRDKRLPIALWKDESNIIVSPAYDVFEIKDTRILNPDYLMMWFLREEFDRNAWFFTDADVRGGLKWEDLCNLHLPVPSIAEQEKIVTEYNALIDREKLNYDFIEKLEETALTIYNRWFVDFEFPDEKGKPYKTNGGGMDFNENLDKEIPKGWGVETLSLLSELKYGKMLNEDFFLEEGYPVFSGYGIRGYYSEYLYKEPQILVIARGVSGTGKVVMSPRNSYVTNLSIVVEVNNQLVNKTFLYYFLKNSNLRSLDSGSAQSQITTKDLSNVKVLMPPLKLQNELAKLIDVLHEHINLKEEDNKLLNKLIGTLLSTLVTRGD
ncbi:restriction endonuclease subunit S [Bacillus atrophaeus]|uniref:restriction endonuclease subunit S n=1 Tax=Bacillus atrophaeus TaxID=1452 RepID=UPI00227FD7C1|nr:restriction endonuclease subunit S [Bacillus atrophaeus]MCY8519184.1 restriction endonuclease subunit S [Bacillus atrophaeus]